MGWTSRCRKLPGPGALKLSQLSVPDISTETQPLRLLVVSAFTPLPEVVDELIAARGLEVIYTETLRQARDPALLAKADAVLLCAPFAEGLPNSGIGEKQLLADALLSHQLTGVVLSPGTAGVVPGDDDALVHVPADLTADELWGRLVTIRQYHPLLQRMERQVAAMQRLGKKLNQQFVEVDQELHLASRLQRDFLPRTFPKVGAIRFAAVYRPATWISGDVYDVRRLDETHLSFLVADAVGHGVAAGLLTMFIKQAAVGKRVHDDGYTIVPPSEVLEILNTELAEQQLPNAQFVTACYGVIDTETDEITFARGGHPHPIHVGVGGECAEVKTVGGLLGVFAGETFPSSRLRLEPGEKFVLYSDGLEKVFFRRVRGEPERIEFTPEFRKMAVRPAAACAEALADHLDRREGSLQPDDDQTCVIIERL